MAGNIFNESWLRLLQRDRKQWRETRDKRQQRKEIFELVRWYYQNEPDKFRIRRLRMRKARRLWVLYRGGDTSEGAAHRADNAVGRQMGLAGSTIARWRGYQGGWEKFLLDVNTRTQRRQVAMAVDNRQKALDLIDKRLKTLEDQVETVEVKNFAAETDTLLRLREFMCGNADSRPGGTVQQLIAALVIEFQKLPEPEREQMFRQVEFLSQPIMLPVAEVEGNGNGNHE